MQVENAIGGGLRKRNSSIELLRIISMLMILFHHFLVHNVADYTLIKFGVVRFILQLFLESGGKIGVVIFFTISCWFFLDKPQTMRGCALRIWKLEKEVLFYSLFLSLFFFLLDRQDISLSLVGRCFMPLIWSVWWYPTAYAMFLCFLPFIDRGLKGMGRNYHIALCCVLLFIYAGISLLPSTQMVEGVYSFIYIYILVSAYKWYLEDVIQLSPIKMIVTGYCIIAIYVFCSMLAYQLYGIQIGVRYHNFLTDGVRLPCLLIGFGTFLIFNNMKFTNSKINWLAAGSFSVYLMTDFSASQTFLWRGVFDLNAAISSVPSFCIAILMMLLLYFSCVLIDSVRRFVFSKYFDFKWDQLFDQGYIFVRNTLHRFEVLDRLLA